MKNLLHGGCTAAVVNFKDVNFIYEDPETLEIVTDPISLTFKIELSIPENSQRPKIDLITIYLPDEIRNILGGDPEATYIADGNYVAVAKGNQ